MSTYLLLINCGSSKTPLLSAFLESQRVHFKEVELSAFHYPDYAGTLSGCIISGAPILLTKPENGQYLSRFAFLKEAEFPVLGICFGHQVMGMVYGARPFLGKPCREPGQVTLRPVESALWKGFNVPVCTFSEDHTEGIDLPEEFVLTASSAHYEVEAMEHQSKPLYGVQFHPETSGSSGKRLLKNFLALFH